MGTLKNSIMETNISTLWRQERGQNEDRK
ncbi:hypothetical protein LSH36_289g02055 [Paralvinella palmiformis]|uniref:Uncharacterized protein n=1 Tax=Paralvinella palmiformis TaxID=53620 RepID=A0AAD9JJL7_9ANNE|nr:hypothetical protein LSH36_289g02055 [Paralvinella palmiformis]